MRLTLAIWLAVRRQSESDRVRRSTAPNLVGVSRTVHCHKPRWGRHWIVTWLSIDLTNLKPHPPSSFCHCHLDILKKEKSTDIFPLLENPRILGCFTVPQFFTFLYWFLIKPVSILHMPTKVHAINIFSIWQWAWGFCPKLIFDGGYSVIVGFWIMQNWDMKGFITPKNSVSFLWTIFCTF